MIFFVQCEGIMRVSASGGTPELAIKANEDETFDGPHHRRPPCDGRILTM